MVVSIYSINHAQPLPSHVGEGVGGGVSIFFIDRILQTPPPPLPLRGGEYVGSPSSSPCRGMGVCWLPQPLPM